MARYLTGDHDYYRRGVLYPPRSVVEIPDDEKPSVTWTKIVEAAEPAVEEVVDNTPDTMAAATPVVETAGTPDTMAAATPKPRGGRAFANREL